MGFLATKIFQLLKRKLRTFIFWVMSRSCFEAEIQFPQTDRKPPRRRWRRGQSYTAPGSRGGRSFVPPQDIVFFESFNGSGEKQSKQCSAKTKFYTFFSFEMKFQMNIREQNLETFQPHPDPLLQSFFQTTKRNKILLISAFPHDIQSLKMMEKMHF